MGVEDIYRNWQFGPEEGKVVQEMWPQYFHKTDKLGRPLYVQNAGVQDVKGLYKVTTPEQLTKNFIQTVESVIRSKYPACQKEFNQPLIDQSFIVMNMKGTGMTAFWWVLFLLPLGPLVDIC